MAVDHKQVSKVAKDHTMFVGKIYHWAKTPKGKFALHPGLQGKCMVCDPNITTVEP